MALQGAGDPIQAQQALATNPLTRAAYSPRAQGIPQGLMLPAQGMAAALPLPAGLNTRSQGLTPGVPIPGMAAALPLPAGLDTRSPLEQAFDPKTPLTAAIDGRSLTASMASIDARSPMPRPAAGMSFKRAFLGMNKM